MLVGIPRSDGSQLWVWMDETVVVRVELVDIPLFNGTMYRMASTRVEQNSQGKREEVVRVTKCSLQGTYCSPADVNDPRPLTLFLRVCDTSCAGYPTPKALSRRQGLNNNTP